MVTIVTATFAFLDFAVVCQPFPVVLNVRSTVRHVNGLDYSVCSHTMFLKHKMCSFVSLTQWQRIHVEFSHGGDGLFRTLHLRKYVHAKTTISHAFAKLNTHERQYAQGTMGRFVHWYTEVYDPTPSLLEILKLEFGHCYKTAGQQGLGYGKYQVILVKAYV